MQEHLELIPKRRKGGGAVAASVLVSLLLHSSLVGYFAMRYLHPPTAEQTEPIRYVEVMAAPPGSNLPFTEAPGPEVETRARPDAPYGSANRKASMPEPTGEKPTLRPGRGGEIYTPPVPPGAGAPSAPAAPQRQASRGGERGSADANRQAMRNDVYRADVTPGGQPQESNPIDWRSAIRDVGKIASLGGAGGMSGGGGEEGFAESGPLSFETQWYPWGDYAETMVRRIRVNWYNNMPALIRMGMKGMVAIRFTIQRSGEITDIEVIRSSGIPPFDFAARKAIELSSPLSPLPKDFPNASERVTCQFYYNMTPPKR